ncbi:MAG: alginate lyase family protein [Candidatus Marinimicrobia bacterium]|nr:alginate lyase family protein [Candidatus Neomarinimicrobiota bacterium]
MKKIILIAIPVMLLVLNCTQEPVVSSNHPNLSISSSEAQDVVLAIKSNTLMDKSYTDLKMKTDQAIASPIDVPEPGESGGYAHEKHKQNYRDMKNAGYMYTFTGDETYARFIKDMLDTYADFYPTLGPHPLSHKQKPGRLFHQMLNETVWLLNTAQAYDCIYDWLSAEDHANYEKNIFIPMVNWFSIDHAEEFNRIHNHGMWTAASVGMMGLVMGNDDFVERALYGTEKDGNGGFLAQIEHLFAPDGYYMEGAYYVRYAMRPLLFFAEALERVKPEVKIYEFKEQIIKKAFYSAVQMTYPNGVFLPINDASLSMDILAPGILFGTSVILDRYGIDKNLLGLAKIQGSVYPNGSGLKLAQAYEKESVVVEPTWSSIEFVDGDDGTQGGFGILRYGKGADQTLLAMKYGVHGLGHGHFDKLHFMYYDQGSDVIPDYGYSRWINIETKFGGRYLPENNSYAKQTITHNTLVIDGKTQNNFNRKAADKVHGNRHFFDATNGDVQVMSATANDHYDGVKMQRTMFLLKDARLDYPVVVDIYRVRSAQRHQYDMPVHFHGQIINSNFEYTVNTAKREPIGKSDGYQHIWQIAQSVVNTDASLTWLDGHRYYSYLTDIDSDTEMIFGMIGANDPNFNLRNEPLLIRRSEGKSEVFASVIEPHGYFSEAQEVSSSVYPELTEIQVIGHSDVATVVKVMGENDIVWTLMITNSEADLEAEHSVEFHGATYSWKGNYKVTLN